MCGFDYPLLVEEYGWILENNEIKPRWFTGHQIPESLRRRKGKSYVADDENEMTENEKKEANTATRKKTTQKKSIKFEGELKRIDGENTNNKSSK